MRILLSQALNAFFTALALFLGGCFAGAGIALGMFMTFTVIGS